MNAAIYLVRSPFFSGDRPTREDRAVRRISHWIKREVITIDQVVSCACSGCIETICLVFGGRRNVSAHYCLELSNLDNTAGKAVEPDELIRRGQRGVDWLRQFVFHYRGQNLLLLSHSGSHVEPMLHIITGVEQTQRPLPYHFVTRIKIDSDRLLWSPELLDMKP